MVTPKDGQPSWPELTLLAGSIRGEVGAQAVEGSAVPGARDQHLLIQDPQQPPAIGARAAGQHLRLPKGHGPRSWTRAEGLRAQPQPCQPAPTSLPPCSAVSPPQTRVGKPSSPGHRPRDPHTHTVSGRDQSPQLRSPAGRGAWGAGLDQEGCLSFKKPKSSRLMLCPPLQLPGLPRAKHTARSLAPLSTRMLQARPEQPTPAVATGTGYLGGAQVDDGQRGQRRALWKIKRHLNIFLENII